MNEVLSGVLLASLAVSPGPPIASAPPVELNWCTVGYTVMVPDGREGEVMSKDGDICRIVAFGEAFATLIPFYLVEPVYPQAFIKQPHSH